jgi:abequosyltransferase
MLGARLSFCIPTYNYGAFLGDAIESIIAQGDDDVEIVIVDGASTDNTHAVVQAFIERGAPIVYHRGSENHGVDRDLALAVHLASGTWCWLLSADDALVPGALAQMRVVLAGGSDIALCNRTLCDRTLVPLRTQTWLSTSTTRTFHLDRADDLRAYLDDAQSIGALFSFISSIVVSRAAWMSCEPSEHAWGSHFAHAHRLLALALAGHALTVVGPPLVLCRGDNDSFARNGQLRRFLIDVDGYGDMGRALLHDDAARAAFFAVVRREHPWFMLAGPRAAAPDLRTWRDVEKRLRALGYTRAQLWMASTLGASPMLLQVARGVRTLGQRMRHTLGRS